MVGSKKVLKLPFYEILWGNCLYNPALLLETDKRTDIGDKITSLVEIITGTNQTNE